MAYFVRISKVFYWISIYMYSIIPIVFFLITFFLLEMSRKEALSQFINQIHGRPVVVKLNSGVDYRGK